MYDTPIGHRVKYLLDHGHQFKPGRKVSVYDLAEATGRSARYIYDLIEDKPNAQNPSLAWLEGVAEYFGINVAFFARSPANYMPPVRTDEIHTLLRSHAPLDDEGKKALDSLIERAKALVAERKAAPENKERS